MSVPITHHALPITARFVLLHGWGVNAGVWTEIRRALCAPCFAPDLFADFSWPNDAGGAEALARAILQRAPARATWIGWSLGGMLALLAARLAPERIERLVLVGVTPKFIAAPDWEHGMSEQAFAAFSAGLHEDLSATLKRFLLLNTGPDDNARALVAGTLREMKERGLPSKTGLEAGLRVLGTLDLRPLLASLRVPVTAVHGSHDRITPPGAARALTRAIPGARLQLIDRAGHAPFLSHPESVLPLLTNSDARAA
jgi:pimeloyl-[acyl-carrier protein] methyl ester esterase